MSSAARHALFLVAELTYSVTPATPALKRVRHTGTSLGTQRGSLQSEELRPDRQIADFRLGTIAVAGDITVELSYGSFDDMLEAVLMGTWTPKAAKTGTTLSAASADDSFNDSANGFADFEDDDLIVVSGFTDANNNGEFVVVTAAAGKLIVTKPDGSDPGLTAEAVGDAVTIQTREAILKAGTVRRSFSVFRNFTDIPDGAGMPWHAFRGIEFNTLALNVTPTAIVTATFGCIGREPELLTAAPAGATFPAATTTAPMDGFTGELLEGGTVCGVATELTLNLDNGLAVENIVGSKLTRRPSVARSNLTGNLGTFFDDATYLEKFLNEADSSLAMAFPDGAGNRYVFEVPKFNYTGGQPDTSGQGSIPMAMPFQGVMDPATLSNMIVRRIPAAA